MEKLRVAAYCRVSTDKDDQANSLDSQRKYFCEYINAHDGWILDNIYYDEGISGTQTKKRVGFNAMIDEALHGRIDLILTKEVCRFARNTVDTLFYTEAERFRLALYSPLTTLIQGTVTGNCVSLSWQVLPRKRAERHLSG